MDKIIGMYEFSDESFERIFAMLDLLHDFASEGRLVEATDLRASEVIGWLEDIIFTAEETIREIDARTLPVPRFDETIADAIDPRAALSNTVGEN